MTALYNKHIHWSKARWWGTNSKIQATLCSCSNLRKQLQNSGSSLSLQKSGCCQFSPVQLKMSYILWKFAGLSQFSQHNWLNPPSFSTVKGRITLTTIHRYHTGLHTENCFVLAEGCYEDRVFHVSGVGFPPPEPSDTSRYVKYLFMFISFDDVILEQMWISPHVTDSGGTSKTASTGLGMVYTVKCLYSPYHHKHIPPCWHYLNSVNWSDSLVFQSLDLIYRAYFGNVNTFGGPSKVSLKISTKLSRYELENDDGVLVFLSDMWLDSIKVCKLSYLKHRMTSWNKWL